MNFKVTGLSEASPCAEGELSAGVEASGEAAGVAAGLAVPQPVKLKTATSTQIMIARNLFIFSSSYLFLTLLTKV
jgi:hypothetical protein